MLIWFRLLFQIQHTMFNLVSIVLHIVAITSVYVSTFQCVFCGRARSCCFCSVRFTSIVLRKIAMFISFILLYFVLVRSFVCSLSSFHHRKYVYIVDSSAKFITKQYWVYIFLYHFFFVSLFSWHFLILLLLLHVEHFDTVLYFSLWCFQFGRLSLCLVFILSFFFLVCYHHIYVDIGVCSWVSHPEWRAIEIETISLLSGQFGTGQIRYWRCHLNYIRPRHHCG